MCMETPLVVGDRRFPSGNPQGRTLPISPPGIPTGFCHKARGCAAAALPRVHSQHIKNPKGVVPGHNAGRLSARARIRQNGQRDHGFTISQPALCGVIKTFVPSAQPRCGCCKHPGRTRGNAGEGVTPGSTAQRLWRSRRGKRRSDCRSEAFCGACQFPAAPTAHPMSAQASDLGIGHENGIEGL